jgi:DNA-directed RNA polymerase subunit RPC12/RpoP
VVYECPACGGRVRPGDIRLEGFRCANCRARLRVTQPPRWLTVLGGLAAGFTVPFLAGARGVPYLVIGVGTYFLFLSAVAYLFVQLFAEIKVDTRPRDSFPHIVPPPG